MTKANVVDKVFSRTWFIDLQDAPVVVFHTMKKSPVSAVVSERIINDVQHVFIDLHPSNDTGARIRTFASEPTPGGSAFEEMPAELLATIWKAIDW